MYEYDSIYDSMEEKKQQKVRAKKAAKDNKVQLNYLVWIISPRSNRSFDSFLLKIFVEFLTFDLS